jgi:hypothetical protein
MAKRMTSELGNTGVHKVWREFTNKFKEFKDNEENYVCIGCDLEDKIQKWAKKYPDDVRIIGCDDSTFSSSCLVLIEHKSKDQYMGTTVVYIPQCTGEKPIEFFLYSSHRDNLIEALLCINRQAKVVQKAETIKRDFVEKEQRNILRKAAKKHDIKLTWNR